MAPKSLKSPQEQLTMGNAPIKATALEYCYKQWILQNPLHSDGCPISITHEHNLRSQPFIFNLQILSSVLSYHIDNSPSTFEIEKTKLMDAKAFGSCKLVSRARNLRCFPAITKGRNCPFSSPCPPASTSVVSSLRRIAETFVLATRQTNNNICFAGSECQTSYPRSIA